MIFNVFLPIEKSDPYKCLIMDLTIPGGMGGQKTIKILQDRFPNVTVIVSGGYSET